jgi:hypothetical protein
MPSAGEPLSTFVMEIWRASVVTILSEKIQPRAPVAPRFQSWLAPAGMESPLVKSGFSIFPLGAAAE